MKYVLGVDVGGTKTLAVVHNEEGELLGVGRSRCGNFQGVGVKKAFVNINEAISMALAEAKLNREDLSYSYFGVAGADSPADFERVEKLLDGLELPAYDFQNDGWIALWSGTVDGVGMVVTCGTGTVSFGRNDRGNWVRLGGLSNFYGDTLGGIGLAASTMSAAVRGKDGRDVGTRLTEMIERLFAAPLNDVIGLEYDGKIEMKDKIPGIIDSLFRAAKCFDGVALSILWNNVREIIKTADCMRKELFTRGEKVKLVLEGSVYKAKEADVFVSMVKNCATDYEIIIPDYPPVLGAVGIALNKVGRRDAVTRAIKELKQEGLK